MKMKWKNILENKCPKCGFELVAESAAFKCQRSGLISSFACDFFVTKERFDQLRRKISEDQLLSDVGRRDNIEELNNL